ncbi:MAG: hypothetical protein HQ594_03595 [Candidatus Omnitrophica bacterium]|nr:hypothetical protein [Candidatus Omnitrophota bacterium]
MVFKNNRKMIVLGIILTFMSPRTLLCDPEAVSGANKIDAVTKIEGHAPAELDRRESRAKRVINKMNLVERVRKFRSRGSWKTLQAAAPLTKAEEAGWKKFNYNEKAATPQGWYEGIEYTCKETSATGKGPLWAKVATSLTSSKTERGESMYGFKLKL